MAHRTFRDSIGRTWDVWTVIPSRAERRKRSEVERAEIAEDRRRGHEARVLLDDRWANGWLAFETRGEKRRVAPYPENWADLSDEALEILCAEGVPAPPSRRLVE